METMADMKRYFFDRDQSGHWYQVQADKRSEWNAWCDLDEDDEAAWDEPEYAERLEMHPASYTFENVEIER